MLQGKNFFLIKSLQNNKEILNMLEIILLSKNQLLLDI